ncbi:MAG: MotA/TolQ/ExbB proton channel family protein [Calditrichaeota bacterium]|nr:MAG: MotA/TolQ/ExbB proton channel family protein [Calditrichota bacterium]
MSFFDILTKGGYLMIPIFLASLVALYIFVERMLTLRKLQIDTRAFILEVKNLILQGMIDDVLALCRKTSGPIAKMTRVAIDNAKFARSDVKDAIDSAGQAEIYILEKNLGMLATVSGVAPMIGFLGTVTGMISAFMEIQTRGGNVDAAVLAGGIWEALITTASGLAVGIMALIFYNWVQGKVERMVFEMEEASAELLGAIIGKGQAQL